MAGLGAKLFTAFSKLTAAQVNGYLMDQSIMRFASAAVRDAAFGGVGEPTLAEGMFCYLDDTNQLQSYNGSAWITITSSTNPLGLELVTGITCSSGGTAANGVVTIGNTVTSVVIGNAFSSTYDSYRIVLTGGTASTSSNQFSFNFNGAPSAWYGNFIYANFASGTPLSVGYNNLAGVTHAASVSSGYSQAIMEIQSPFLTTPSFFSSHFVDGSNAGRTQATNANSTSYTGFILTINTGTCTGGTVRVYGYRNQL